MLSRSVFRAVRTTSRCRWYSGSSEFDNLVSDALKKANISDSDDVAKLQKNNISSLDTLRSMSPDDFNQIGVTVGSRIAIQQALNDLDAEEHSIRRSNSYKPGDTKKRAM